MLHCSYFPTCGNRGLDHTSLQRWTTVKRSLEIQSLDLLKGDGSLCKDGKFPFLARTLWRLVLCPSYICHSLGFQQSISRVLVWVPAAPPQIQFPANEPGKAVDNGPSVWPLTPTWENKAELWTPGCSQVQPWMLQLFGRTSQWMGNLYLSFSLLFAF